MPDVVAFIVPTKFRLLAERVISRPFDRMVDPVSFRSIPIPVVKLPGVLPRMFTVPELLAKMDELQTSFTPSGLGELPSDTPDTLIEPLFVVRHDPET